MSKNAPIYIGNRQLLDTSAISGISASLLQQMLSSFTGSEDGQISEYGYTPLNQNGEIDSKFINLTAADTDTPIVTHVNKLNFVGDFISVTSGESGEAIISLNIPVENPDYSVLKASSFQQIYDGKPMIIPENTETIKLYDDTWKAGNTYTGINDIVSLDTSISPLQRYTWFKLKSKLPIYIPNENTYFRITIKTVNNTIIAKTAQFNVKNVSTIAPAFSEILLTENTTEIVHTLDYDNIICQISNIKEIDTFYTADISLSFNLSKLIGKVTNLNGGQFQITVQHLQQINSYQVNRGVNRSSKMYRYIYIR